MEKTKQGFFTNTKLVLVMMGIGVAYALVSGNNPFVLPTTTNPINYAYMMLIAFLQNVSFSMVSRARNRDSMMYHMIAAWCSNGVWFATFAYLVTHQLVWALFIPYTCGTVAGSLTGTQISMWIERMLGATSDSHVKKVPTRLELQDNETGETQAIQVAGGRIHIHVIAPAQK